MQLGLRRRAVQLNGRKGGGTLIRINPGGNGESQVPKSLLVKTGWGIFFIKWRLG